MQAWRSSSQQLIAQIRYHLFTERTKALVGTIPTYEECAGYADMMGNPVHGVPLDPNFKMDLDRMADAAKGAGLIFYCNPNNPTSTYVGARATRGRPRLAASRRARWARARSLSLSLTSFL